MVLHASNNRLLEGDIKGDDGAVASKLLPGILKSGGVAMPPWDHSVEKSLLGIFENTLVR